jgi:hypothetical protein
MIITVHAHNVDFIFNDWVGYRSQISRVNGIDIYPDLMRISNVFPYWDVEVGLKCINGNLKYHAEPQSCLWMMHTTQEFEFLREVYYKLYPELIRYDDINLAKSRVDDLLLKYNKLGCFL